MIYTMKEALDKNRLGLAVGFLFAALHALWAIAIGLMPRTMQSFLDFIFEIHFLEPVMQITSFGLIQAVMLVLVTFVAGYVLGWAIALFWNVSTSRKG